MPSKCLWGSILIKKIILVYMFGKRLCGKMKRRKREESIFAHRFPWFPCFSGLGNVMRDQRRSSSCCTLSDAKIITIIMYSWWEKKGKDRKKIWKGAERSKCTCPSLDRRGAIPTMLRAGVLYGILSCCEQRSLRSPSNVIIIARFLPSILIVIRWLCIIRNYRIYE